MMLQLQRRKILKFYWLPQTSFGSLKKWCNIIACPYLEGSALCLFRRQYVNMLEHSFCLKPFVYNYLLLQKRNHTNLQTKQKYETPNQTIKTLEKIVVRSKKAFF